MYCRYLLVLSNSEILLVVFSTDTKAEQIALWQAVNERRGAPLREGAKLDSFSVEDISPRLLLIYERHKIKISPIFESNSFPVLEEVPDNRSFEDRMQIARKNYIKRNKWAYQIRDKHIQLFEAYEETIGWSSSPCRFLAFFTKILRRFCSRN